MGGGCYWTIRLSQPSLAGVGAGAELGKKTEITNPRGEGRYPLLVKDQYISGFFLLKASLNASCFKPSPSLRPA